MHNALEVCTAGLRDAVQIHRTLLFMVTDRLTAIRTLQCFTLNGLIFLGSIYVFDYALKPMIYALGDRLQLLHMQNLSEEPGVANDNGVDMKAETEANWNVVKEIIEQVTSLIFTFFWLVPMYSLSFILNLVWYRDIAEQVFRQEKGRMRVNDSITGLIRDELYRTLLMAWCSILSFVIYLVPYVGSPLCLAYTSWIYAFYCFDYKWTMEGWSFQRRLTVFQDNWVYMLGFGMPCSAVTLWLPQFVALGMYAMVFPICMILAIISKPVRHQHSKIIPRSIRMFAFGEYVNLLVLRMLIPRTTTTPSSTESSSSSLPSKLDISTKTPSSSST